MVKVGDAFSSWENGEQGIPQGRVLGPILFNSFINDLFFHVTQTKLNAYADDHQIYQPDVDPLVLHRYICNDVEKANQWYSQNGTIVNAKKHQALIICQTASAPTLAEVEEKIRPDFDAVSMWAKENKLKMHPVKTKYSIISTRQKIESSANQSLVFSVDSMQLTKVESERVLGVYIDSHLTWNEHIDTLRRKLLQRIEILARARK